MRWLLFLSRLAFICGICILLSLSFLMWKWINEEDIKRTVITIGFLLGLIVLPLTLLSYLGVLITRKNLVKAVPLWLIVCNIIWFILLLFYIISINSHSNDQNNYIP